MAEVWGNPPGTFLRLGVLASPETPAAKAAVVESGETEEIAASLTSPLISLGTWAASAAVVESGAAEEIVAEDMSGSVFSSRRSSGNKTLFSIPSSPASLRAVVSTVQSPSTTYYS